MTELRKILYVEDEPDIQTVARMALEMLGGYDVKVCGDGHEALREAAAYRPDLIVLDVMMPGMDGPSTLAELRRLPDLAATPVVFMTAKVQPAEIRHFLSLGVADVIAKPFDPMTLATTVQATWDRLQRDAD
ncbi:response regulator [Methylococcus sp. EFPC2]|uniref:response regulator n=1 Tax=Methylococcus sp. EFPC2 TaxID=2812648 RepID=UPI001967E018|nr:response regulator [Methylococcus sp. EFPC2]QSA95661.1 response regulator [Methylococcus sp. EFPC2]